jgi:hypothetical protein
MIFFDLVGFHEFLIPIESIVSATYEEDILLLTKLSLFLPILRTREEDKKTKA